MFSLDSSSYGGGGGVGVDGGSVVVMLLVMMVVEAEVDIDHGRDCSPHVQVTTTETEYCNQSLCPVQYNLSKNTHAPGWSWVTVLKRLA